MNDFLNGWSQGMTGSTSGLPSQSVMEAMGRDAARNQWNNQNNSQTHSSGGAQSDGDDVEFIPLHTVLYQAGQKMRFKKLARDFALGLAISTITALLSRIFQQDLASWILGGIGLIGFFFMFWVSIRLPFYLIAKAGDAIKGPKAVEKEEASP